MIPTGKEFVYKTMHLAKNDDNGECMLGINMRSGPLYFIFYSPQDRKKMRQKHFGKILISENAFW